jgi:5-carboxymethyl-2-hydroxymuconate isomerase
MPHIILEHSSNVEEKIEYKEFFKEAVDLMVVQGVIPNSGCTKCRYIKTDEFLVDKEGGRFVHLTLALLEGRSKEMLKNIGAGLKELAESYFKKTKASYPDSFSLEVREMDVELYQK